MKSDIFILEPEEWRQISSAENGFVDVAAFNSLNFTFEYKWHYDYRPRNFKTNPNKSIKFDPGLSAPDCLKVGIRADSIELVVYPMIIPCLLNFKENVFGYWDMYTPFQNETGPETINIDDQIFEDISGWKPPFRPFRYLLVFVEQLFIVY